MNMIKGIRLGLVLFCGVICCMASAGIAETRGGWSSVPLGGVKVGGEIGVRIDLTLTNNVMVLDYDRDFLAAFRTKDGKKTFVGTGNMIEALVSLAKYTGDAKVIAKKRALVDAVIAAQEPGGYIGCMPPDKRVWYAWDMEDVGFILDGLVLDHELFGERRSLDAAKKAADWVLANWRNPPKDWDRLIYDKELLMGLVHGMWTLHRATGDRRYSDFCTKTFDYLHWNMPIVLGRSEGIRGHLAGYLDTCFAQLEMYRELGDRALWRQTGRFLDHYLRGNGGLITGLEGICECASADQDGRGCAGETCMSAYALCVLDLALRTGACDTALAGNVMERVLYNGFFAAQSRNGRKLRYYTPLVGPRGFWPNDDYCCPCNYRRIIGHLPEYLFYVKKDEIVANLFSEAVAELDLSDAGKVRIAEKTAYPADGSIAFAIEPEKDGAEFAFSVRIPKWCADPCLRVNGQLVGDVRAGELASVRRAWSKGDLVEANFSMPVRLVKGRGRQAGRVAFMRGPVVYALDARKVKAVVETDNVEHFNGGATSVEDLLVVYPGTARFENGAILAKGSTVSFQLGPDCKWSEVMEIRFTPFADEENTLTYFRVPDPADRTLRDDELFSGTLK